MENQNELFAALAKAQGQFKTVAASRHVTIKMKEGGSYSYNYATLASIMDMIRGPFKDNNLSIAQLIVGDELVTILGHSSGQSISSTVALPRSGDIKGMGANLTYLRRYSITAIAGVAIDEEDDENVTGGKVDLKPQAKPNPVEITDQAKLTNGKRTFSTPREAYLTTINDLLEKLTAMGHKPDLDPNFLNTASDSELIDFGKELRQKVAEFNQPIAKAT